MKNCGHIMFICKQCHTLKQLGYWKVADKELKSDIHARC